jgi:hypothetical protein
MSFDLRKAAADTAYIAVGIGVLGVQQAQVRRRELQARLGDWRTRTCGRLRAKAAETGERVRALRPELPGALRGPQAITEAVGPAVADVTGRVEGLAHRLAELPARAGRAVEAGRTQLAHLRVPLVATA